MAHIYLADDEIKIRNILSDFLINEGYAVTAFETGDALLAEFKKTPCDLILLDIMMPGTDGMSVLAKLRERSNVPIIMLTAKDSDSDHYSGLSMGSDDYITKPFKPMLLSAKIKALLRRVDFQKEVQGNDDRQDLSYGNCTYSVKKHEVTVDGRKIPMTPTEMQYICYMMKRSGEAVSRSEILDGVWGIDCDVETRVADETNRRVRKKLLEAGSDVYIQTVWGYGFKMVRRGEEV